MANTEKKLSGIQRQKPEYTIVSCSVPDQLQRLVNEGIAQGWEPVGGVCVDSRDGQFYQAMVRRA